MGGKAQLGRFSSFLKSSRNQRGISIVRRFPLEGGCPVPLFPSSTLEGGVFVCLLIFLSPLAHGAPCKSQSMCLCCEFPWSVSFLLCALVTGRGREAGDRSPLLNSAAGGLGAREQSQSLGLCGLSLHPCSLHPWDPYVQPHAGTALSFQAILRLNSHRFFTFIKRQNCFLQLVKHERHSCLWIM